MSETLRDVHVRIARSYLMSPPSGLAMLGENESLSGLRVLVLGSSVTDTLCALMHTECRQAETRTPGCLTDARSADLVLVPRLTSENVDRVISQASHALCQHGRIIIAFPVGQDLLSHVAMMLLGAGFQLPAVLGEGDRKRLSATRGPHLCSVCPG